VWIERRKWPDAPHYGHPGWVLGSDEHGTWLELRKGSPIRRADELVRHAEETAAMVLAAVMAGEAPFDGSRADAWRRQRSR